MSEEDNFWYAVSETFRMNGPMPTEVDNPAVGDLRADPVMGAQCWTGEYWYPRIVWVDGKREVYDRDTWAKTPKDE